MPKTIAERILSEKGHRDATAGDIVIADVDLLMAQDGTAPLSIQAFRDMGGRKVLDAAKKRPQFIVRDGVLLVLPRVDKLPSQRPKDLSAWDALASGAGLQVTFPRMDGKVPKVAL